MEGYQYYQYLMNQNLYFQRHHPVSGQSSSFFSCLDCNMQPQEIYVERMQNSGQKILHTNIYLEPNPPTQDGFSYTRSGVSNDMISSRKSINGRQSKKISISGSVSRKSVHTKGMANSSERSVIADSSRRQTLAPNQSINVTRMINSNGPVAPPPVQPEFRFSTNQNPYRNSPNQMLYSICTPMRQSMPVVFNYEKTHEQPPVCNQVIVNSNVETNGRIQRKESIKQSILIGSFEQLTTEKPGEVTHGGERLSQFYPHKHIMESLEFEQGKRSERMMNEQKMKNETKENFGNGRVNLKIRQTVSIRQSEQDELHESFVLSNSNSNSEFLQKLRRPFLRPITESQLQRQSYIDPSFGGQRRL